MGGRLYSGYNYCRYPFLNRADSLSDGAQNTHSKYTAICSPNRSMWHYKGSLSYFKMTWGELSVPFYNNG